MLRCAVDFRVVVPQTTFTPENFLRETSKTELFVSTDFICWFFKLAIKNDLVKNKAKNCIRVTSALKSNQPRNLFYF